eukprot:10113271-Alexandrium_andersonii.AAC.1
MPMPSIQRLVSTRPPCRLSSSQVAAGRLGGPPCAVGQLAQERNMAGARCCPQQCASRISL